MLCFKNICVQVYSMQFRDALLCVAVHNIFLYIAMLCCYQVTTQWHSKPLQWNKISKPSFVNLCKLKQHACSSMRTTDGQFHYTQWKQTAVIKSQCLMNVYTSKYLNMTANALTIQHLKQSRKTKWDPEVIVTVVDTHLSLRNRNVIRMLIRNLQLIKETGFCLHKGVGLLLANFICLGWFNYVLYNMICLTFWVFKYHWYHGN